MSFRNRLEIHLVLYVVLSLLVFLIASTIVIYHISFQDAIADSHHAQNNLVNALRIQAAAAVHTENELILDGVAKGLLSDPRFIGLHILGTNGFNRIKGIATRDSDGTHYKLYTPFVSDKDPIGELIVFKDDRLIVKTARNKAFKQISIFVVMILMGSIIVMNITRRLVSSPIVRIAREITDYVPHHDMMVNVPAGHESDEIGRIATSINTLIRTSEAINRNLILFHHLIENAHDLIHITDINGRFLDSSKSGYLLLGYTKDELLQLCVWDVEATLPSISEWQQVVTVLRQTGEIIVSGISVRKDGSRFPTEVRASFIVTDYGEFTLAIIRDITERKQYEDHLRALEERSRLILSSVHDGIIGVDTNGKTIFVNQAASTLLGYTEEHLTDRHLHNLIHHSHADGKRHEIEECPILQTAHNGLAQLVKFDTLWGKGDVPIPVEYTTTPMYRDNSLLGSVFVFRDITERQKIEAKVAALEEQSRSVLSAVRDGIIYMDATGSITLANPAAISLLGYKDEELVGRPMYATLRYAHSDGTKYPIEQCPMHLTLMDGQYRISDKEVFWLRNGQSIPVEYAISPLYKNETIIGTVVVFRDITDRKNAEEAFLNAHRQQQAIFESATIGIAVMQDRIFRKCNRKFYELVGYNQDELIGQTTRCLYIDDITYQEVGLAYNKLNNGESYQRIVQLQRKDGSRFICNLSGSAITAGDMSQGSVWTLQDITNEVEAVDSLQQAKELAESAARI